MKKLFFVLCAINAVLCGQAQEVERKFAYDNYVKYSKLAMWKQGRISIHYKMMLV